LGVIREDKFQPFPPLRFQTSSETPSTPSIHRSFSDQPIKEPRFHHLSLSFPPALSRFIAQIPFVPLSDSFRTRKELATAICSLLLSRHKKAASSVITQIRATRHRIALVSFFFSFFTIQVQGDIENGLE